MSYINVIITACFVFPFLSFLITLPYIIYNYNKYGSVLFVRSIIVYSFVLYLLSAYFLIIMPLPSFEYASHIKTKVQLIPFDLVSKIMKTVHFDYKDISSYINVLKNPFVYQTIYNTFLTIPFGIFLRYYYKFTFKKILLFTFLLSLFFELTQLTGIYFIYPNAYRLFDVDDLIVNTLGGIIGFVISPLLMKFLPTKDELDLKSYKKGWRVSSTKRIITFIIDLTFVFIFICFEYLFIYLFGVYNKYYVYILISFIIFFLIIPFITGGQTLGYKITNIIIRNNDGTFVKRYKVLFRNTLLTTIYIPLYYYLYLLFMFINKISKNNYDSLIIGGYISTVIIISVLIFVRNFILHKDFKYEKISKTKLYSTIEKFDGEKKINQ